MSALIESLEERALLSAAAPAKILNAYFDNRGSAFFNLSLGLNTATLSKKTASFYTAGADGVLGTGDDTRISTIVGYRKGYLSLRSKSLGLNQAYRVFLNAGVIKDINGKALDGEFNGANAASGNGVAGGNFDAISKAPTGVTYRFTVICGVGQIGYVNVNMFTNTPNTVANFKQYADAGAWDTTFFHRSTRDATSGIQVIQGGGFTANTAGNIGSTVSHTGIGLELHNSNVKGTIAMARTSDPNSNTNQWFFNINDNTTLDTTGGGYTVFGKVADKGSQAVIQAVNNLTIRQGDPSNVNSPFNELPSLDPTGQIDVPGDLALVTRVVELMGQAAPTRALGAAAPAIRAAATAAAIAPSTAFATTTLDRHDPVWDEA